MAQYVVAPAGDDAAVGSVDAPWKTLQHAARLVQPGDTVTVRAGTYAGFVMGWDYPQGGTAEAPIVFQAEPGAVIASKCNKTQDAIDLEGASYVTIQGFAITNEAGTIGRAGIRAVQGSHVVIRNNTVDRAGTWGIFTSFVDDVLIEGNVTSRSRKQHGIYVSNSGDRPVVRRNVSWGNRVCGLHFNGDASQGGDGIIDGALIEDNVAWDNGTGGGSAINCDGVQNSVIRRNFLIGNHASGISLFREDGGGPSTGNVVKENVVVVAADGRWALNIKGGSVGNTAVGNILLNENPGRGSINIVADSLPGFTSDFNILTPVFSIDDGETHLDLEGWQETTCQDRYSLPRPADPLIASLAGYKVLETRPPDAP